MNRLLTFALIAFTAQYAFAGELKRMDDAEAWLQASPTEQLTLVSVLAAEAGISKKSGLRYVMLCMRDVASNSADAKGIIINDLFNACLPRVSD